MAGFNITGGGSILGSAGHYDAATDTHFLTMAEYEEFRKKGYIGSNLKGNKKYIPSNSSLKVAAQDRADVMALHMESLRQQMYSDYMTATYSTGTSLLVDADAAPEVLTMIKKYDDAKLPFERRLDKEIRDWCGGILDK